MLQFRVQTAKISPTFPDKWNCNRFTKFCQHRY